MNIGIFAVNIIVQSGSSQYLKTRMITSIGLYIFIGYILTFKTEVIAKIVKANEVQDDLHSLSQNVILKTGIILISIYYLLQKFPFVFQTVLQIIMGNFRTSDFHNPMVINDFISVLISIVLIFAAGKIANLLAKN